MVDWYPGFRHEAHANIYSLFTCVPSLQRKCWTQLRMLSNVTVSSRSPPGAGLEVCRSVLYQVSAQTNIRTHDPRAHRHLLFRRACRFCIKTISIQCTRNDPFVLCPTFTSQTWVVCTVQMPARSQRHLVMTRVQSQHRPASSNHFHY